VKFAVKSLSDADLPDDRIGIQFVQVGFSRRLFDALKEVVENDHTASVSVRNDRTQTDAALFAQNLADFTTYTGAGSTVDQRLGRISLGNVDATLSRPSETSRSTSRHIALVPADPPPNSLAIEQTTLMSGREPVLHFPAYLRHVSLEFGIISLLTTPHVEMVP